MNTWPRVTKNLIPFLIIGHLFLLMISCNKDVELGPYPGPFSHADSFPPSITDYYVGKYEGYKLIPDYRTQTFDTSQTNIIFKRVPFEKECLISDRGMKYIPRGQTKLLHTNGLFSGLDYYTKINLSFFGDSIHLDYYSRTSGLYIRAKKVK